MNVTFCASFLTRLDFFFVYTYATTPDEIGKLSETHSYHTFDFCLHLLWLTLEWMWRCAMLFILCTHDADYISGLGWLDIDSIDIAWLSFSRAPKSKANPIVYTSLHTHFFPNVIFFVTFSSWFCTLTLLSALSCVLQNVNTECGTFLFIFCMQNVIILIKNSFMMSTWIISQCRLLDKF